MNPLTIATSKGSLNLRNRRSITSKISSFLTNKSTHINAFSIELDEPLRRYGPGDTVKGTVALNVGKPLGVTHIVTCLYGYVQVFKNHSRPSATPRNNSGRIVTGQGKRWVSEYYGDGFASLFEEEVVLCGEGRLDPKLYHFRFEIDFPNNLALPTSIDFERGTITYVVSSTITRPSSIAVTTTCDTKVYYRENIDVGRLSAPKAREITLRPLDLDIKPKGGMKRLTSYERKRTSPTSTPSGRNRSTRTLESRAETDSSRYPSTSIPSSRSSSSSRDRVASLTSDLRSSRNSQSPIPSHETLQKSISVSVEPSKSGCLAGEILSILIRINHTKVIQSLHGVIVTLYRQARVDMHPNLPIVTGSKSREERFEDYYPRSKTGLGGLSLSAAGSSQAWRKDLSQTFAPLYIDPRTKSTEVKVALRVPDEAFPSIRNVPGEMISFNYFVEVIIDIHGKLAAGPSFPSMNITTLQLPSYPNTPRGQSNDAADYVSAAWEANFVDTSQIKREKNAIVVQCDLIIGTRDSNKARGKQKVESQDHQSRDRLPSSHDALTTVGTDTLDDDGGNDTVAPANFDTYGYEFANEPSQGSEYYDYGSAFEYEDGYYYPHSYSYPYDPQHPYQNSIADPMGAYPSIPVPVMPDELDLPEKERLRRAEARLLPSRPPAANNFTLPAAHDGATAPLLPSDELYDMPQTHRQMLAENNHPLVHGQSPGDVRDGHGHSIHTAGERNCLDDASSFRTKHFEQAAPPLQQGAEKEDVERQRLEAEASAPEIDGIAPEEGPSAPPAAVVTAAADLSLSAISAEEAATVGVRGLGAETNGAAGESLPRYER